MKTNPLNNDIMQRYRYLYTILVLLCLQLVATAQPICKVRTFGTENGLPASVISGMTQSTDNLIWITTWNGLSCYDGYRFTTFRNIPGHDSQLTTNHLISVMPATDGNLWTTAYTDDVYMFDSQKCQYVNVSALITKKFQSRFSLRKIYPLANGDTWVVGKYNEHYHMAKGDSDSDRDIRRFTLPGTLNKVVLDGFGDEWLFCDQGAFVYTEKGSPRQVARLWVDFVEKVGNTLWLVTVDGKILHMKRGGKPTEVRLANKVDKVKEVKVIKGRILALATDRGVLMYDTKTGHDRLLSVQWPGNPQPMVDVMFADSRERLWCFNSGKGLTMITPDMQTVHLAVETCGGMFTLADKPLFHEDSRHTVWIASTGTVFSYYDEDRKSLVAQPLGVSGVSGELIPRLKKGFSDHQGNLWLDRKSVV